MVVHIELSNKGVTRFKVPTDNAGAGFRMLADVAAELEALDHALQTRAARPEKIASTAKV